MPKHKIEVRAAANGLWSIHSVNPEILHAFAHFYNTVINHRNGRSADTIHTTYDHDKVIIIDNQTGQIIRDSLHQNSKR